MSGVLRLVLFQARRDRVTLPVWILGITLLSFATSTAVTTQFGDEAAQAAILTLAASNPAFLFLRGLPDGTGVGAVVFFQGYAFTAVLAGLMSAFQVVRHTRSDEELGRAELLGAVPDPAGSIPDGDAGVGRRGEPAARRQCCYRFHCCRVARRRCFGAGSAVGIVGVFFTGLAAVAAQVLPTGRAANGAAAGLVGVRIPGPRRRRCVGDSVSGPAPRSRGLALAPVAHRLGATGAAVHQSRPGGAAGPARCRGWSWAPLAGADPTAAGRGCEPAAPTRRQGAGRGRAAPRSWAWPGGCSAPPWPGGALGPRPGCGGGRPWPVWSLRPCPAWHR